LKALVDPAKTSNALSSLLKTSFMHYIDHSSLALVSFFFVSDDTLFTNELRLFLLLNVDYESEVPISKRKPLKL
jgi:hypothetical protein